MITITFIQNDGDHRQVAAEAGETLMQCALSHRIPGIAAECGGCAACGTCHAYIDPAWQACTGEASEDERLMLDGAESARPNSRLICQIQLTEAHDGLVVRLPAA